MGGRERGERGEILTSFSSNNRLTQRTGKAPSWKNTKKMMRRRRRRLREQERVETKLSAEQNRFFLRKKCVLRCKKKK